MPILGGLFSRKNKSVSSSRGDDRSDSLHSTVVSDYDPGLSPTSTSSYVTPNRAVPSYPNASNLLHPDSARQNYAYRPPVVASPTPSTSSNGGSRLRLPFGRKKSATAQLNPSEIDPPRKSFQTSPRPQQDRSSTDTDGAELRRLRPPPSRSAIFAAYGDPNSALSTRSLPNESSPFSLSESLPPTPPPKKNLFGWGKNPNPSPTPSPTRLDGGSLSNGYQDSAGSPISQDGSSFNLRSFRHVRPPSPTGSNASLALPVPRPRPRGESVNSDSAQRISVAAFREAQARRSQAGSPSPSFRSTSPALGLPNQPRAMTPDGAHGRNSPRPSRSASHMPSQQQQRRRSSMAIQSTSDSDPTASSSEEDSEDETAQPGNRTHRALNTPGLPGRTKAKSELGHGRHAPMASSKSSDFPLPPRGPSSHVGHSYSPASDTSRVDENRKVPPSPSRPQSTLSVYSTNLRPRASVSTSAITPSSAAKRASILAASNSRMGNTSGTDSKTSLVAPQNQNVLRTPQLNPQPSKSSINTQTRAPAPRQSTFDSDSDSEDDAPLAKLVGPRRPGSAMSSYSNLHSRSTGNVTTRSATHMPPKPLIDINELTGPKRSQTSPQEKNTAGFTGGNTLLAQKTQAHTPSPLVESPVSMHHSPPWQSNATREHPQPLTTNVAPVKFATPMGSPVQEKAQFLSNKELDAALHNRNSTGDTSERAAVRQDSAPDARRDALTERLSRAVKNTLLSSPQETSGPESASTAGSPQPSFTSRETSIPAQSVSNITSTNGVDNAPAARARPARSEMPFPRSKSSLDHSPPDEELALLLGTAVQFMSGGDPPQNNTPPPSAPQKARAGSSDSSSSSSDSSDDVEEYNTAPTASKDRIAPIPIKQRSPPPSFSVTSRPPVNRRDDTGSATGPAQRISLHTGYEQRPRSTTLQASSSSGTTSFGSTSFGSPRKSSGGESPAHTSSKSVGSLNGNAALAAAAASTAQPKPERGAVLKPGPGGGVRQRSSTMITGVPLSAQMNKTPVASAAPAQPPEKPFAMRRNSPASSTGGSSSGRTPLTPRDGSDIGERKQEVAPLPERGVQRRHIKRRSVSFEDDLEELRPPSRSYLRAPTSSRGSSDAGDVSTDDGEERRRRERRRGEAKASIELGNVVNGRGPVLDEDDEDLPVNRAMNPRMSAVNPMMAMGSPLAMQMGQMGFGGAPGAAMWSGGMGMAQPMLSPAQFMVPPPADPAFLAAHQQAMAYAKQAYQMAVAQQAMAAAADEWERGSTVGGFGGGGSVYGGSQMGSSFGMMGGMNMMQGGWGSTASMYGGGGGARSMYGGSQLGVPDMMSSSRSEFGGGGGRSGGGNWSSSRSSYGESFGPDQTTRRPGQPGRRGAAGGSRESSGYFPPVPLISAAQLSSGRTSPELKNGRGKASPGNPRKAPPPSSWKAG